MGPHVPQGVACSTHTCERAPAPTVAILKPSRPSRKKKRPGVPGPSRGVVFGYLGARVAPCYSGVTFVTLSRIPYVRGILVVPGRSNAMYTKRSFSLLQVGVVIGMLVVGAQGAIAQVRGYRTPGVRVTQSRWSRASLYGARAWTPRPQAVVQPQVGITERTETATTSTTGVGTAIINTSTSTNTNTNTNTNIVIVRPQVPSYYGYGGYGGYSYGYPGYRGRTTYRYFDRGIFNAMPGPFGLSSFRPLEVTTIP